MMNRSIDRRSFLTTTGMAGVGIAFGGHARAADMPSYLKGYEAEYAKDPKAAALKWFREAKYGLFIHYGLYSLLGKGEWIQFHDVIPIKEYEKLMYKFDAAGYDASGLCDLAIASGMKYINLVCKHCDSFALWGTQETPFQTRRAAATRDLVMEMAMACKEKGLGFFVFYEHGFDWRHPHGPAPWLFKSKSVRPPYDPPDPWYASREEYDFNKYVDYANAQIKELITDFGPVAGVWFDGIGIPLSGDQTLFRTSETYAMIRQIQPQALISYKFGLTGEEDFFAPEDVQLNRMEGKDRAGKPMEICACMQLKPEGPNRRYAHWGYNKFATHRTSEQVWEELKRINGLGANLLLNIGPLPDGSVHPDDEKALLAVGKCIKSEGYPAA